MPTVNIPIKRFSDSRMGEKDRHGNYFHDLVDRHRTFLRATFPPALPVLNHVASLPQRLLGWERGFQDMPFYRGRFPKLVTPGSVVQFVM
jgi:hypothetical protein